MFSRHKKLLLILVGLVIVFFAYWYFVLSKKQEAPVNANGGGGLVRPADATNIGTSTARLEIDKKFVNGILSLNAVNIDTDLFKTPAYQALNFPDKPFEIDYEIAVGRGNPFLPIGVNSREQLVGGQNRPGQQTPPATVATSTATSTRATSTPANPRPNPSRVN